MQYSTQGVPFIEAWSNWNGKEWVKNKLSMSRAPSYILHLKALNVSSLDRRRGYLVLSVKSLLLPVDLLPEVKPLLYILKHNPHLFCLRRANFHHKDTRTVNIDLLDGWCTSHHRPLKHLLLTTQPSRLWGNNPKWPPVLSAADCKYLKEINFSEWKAPFFVLSPPLLPSHVDLGLCTLPAPVLLNCLLAKITVVFLPGFRNHCKYSSQWRCIFFLSWQSVGKAPASGHLPAIVIGGRGKRETEIGTALSNYCPHMTMKMDHHCRPKRKVWISSTALLFGRKL